MQLVEILSHNSKIKTIYDLINYIDLIIELVREDVLRISKSKQILFDDFDFTYAYATKMLKSQLQKTHLQAIKRFFKFKNIKDALKWIVSRILNNAVNITTNKKYLLYCAPNIIQINQAIEIESDYSETIELLDLEKIDTKTMITGLKKVWLEGKYDLDFDYLDFEELCCKFGCKANEVVGSYAFEKPKLSKHQVGIGQFQLKLLL